MMGLVVAALGLGLLSNLHCVAMCGPLALAGCRKKERVELRDLLGYGFGRIFSYSFLGALMGHFGHHLAHSVSLEWLQVVASLALAAVALWQGLRLLAPRSKAPTLVQLGGKGRARPRWAFVASLVPRRGWGLGLATGILPCGVMMGAWLLAASTGTAMRGSLTMLIFAVATLPGLLAPVLAGGVLTPALRRLRPAWYGWAWCLLAVWVGARPLMTALHGGH